MTEQNQPFETLQDIKQMMEKSSKFISLSGWSGVAAGTCALIGAFVIKGITNNFEGMADLTADDPRAGESVMNIMMITMIGLAVFVGALALSIFFTYKRSKKTGVPMWGKVARRLMWNTAIPIIVGGIFIIRLLELKLLGLVAPACLLFYGLGLINGSKYTLGEVRYLGYGQILLGFINLWMIGYGLYFWMAGFGVLHIVYGIIMWWKYERRS
jgi:hypothetical protein